MPLPDVRTPADPQDFETTNAKSAVPPVEFTVLAGASSTSFTIKDRQFVAQRGPTVAYRVYFLPAAFSSAVPSTASNRLAGQRVSSLVGEVPSTGRGDTLTFTDTQFFGQAGHYYCVGVNRASIEAPPEHLVKAPL